MSEISETIRDLLKEMENINPTNGLPLGLLEVNVSVLPFANIDWRTGAVNLS